MGMNSRYLMTALALGLIFCCLVSGFTTTLTSDIIRAVIGGIVGVVVLIYAWMVED